MTRVDRLLIVCIATCMFAPAAHAQSAAAEALFREGRRLIKDGKLDAGCAKLEASDKLESSVGTLLNLGDCREKQGKPASAWAAFRKAEAMARRAGNDKRREQEARRRASKLEPQLASITVQVGPRGRGDGITIKRDGELLDPDVWGTAIVVDPGSHTIVAEAPGKKPWRSDVALGKGGKRYVVVPTLEAAPEARPIVTAPPPPAPAPVVVTTAPEPPRATTTIVQPTWNSTRQAAVIIGIVGVGALGAGAYFGAHAKDLENRSDAICPTSECADAGALKLNSDAQSAALRANILFVAGGAAAAAATIMWFAGKPEAETIVTPAVGPTQVGATLTRRF